MSDSKPRVGVLTSNVAPQEKEEPLILQTINFSDDQPAEDTKKK
jgi:hypothetical protein